MRIEILHIAECPNWRSLEPLIEQANDPDLLAESEITFRLLTSEEEAEAMDIAGSPTIHVNGRDLFPSNGYPGGLACRVYSTPDGLAGMPSVGQIRKALELRRVESPIVV